MANDGNVRRLNGEETGKTLAQHLETNRPYLRNADLTDCNISEDFREGNFEGSSFKGSKISQSNLRNANLNRSNFEGAKFHDVDLTGAKLKDANLRGAILDRVTFTNANLWNADLSSAEISKAIGLSDEVLQGAHYDLKTVWPEGYQPKLQFSSRTNQEFIQELTSDVRDLTLALDSLGRSSQSAVGSDSTLPRQKSESADGHRTKAELEFEKLSHEVEKARRENSEWNKFLSSARVLIPILIGAGSLGIACNIDRNAALLDRINIQKEQAENKIKAGIIKNERKVILRTLKALVDEPSGLSSSHLIGMESETLLLGVDDETDGFFVFSCSSLSDKSPFIPKKLFHFKQSKKIKDIEAICFDPNSTDYYAIPSHRKIKPAKLKKNDTKLERGQSKTCQIIRFRINAKDWNNPHYKEVDIIENLDLTEEIAAALEGVVKIERVKKEKEFHMSINGQNWTEKTDIETIAKAANTKKLLQPFALEIEGASIIPLEQSRRSILLLGLKYPLENSNKAFILYGELKNTIGIKGKEQPKNKGIKLKAKTLDLGGYGITDLDFHVESGNLYVAANPTIKPRSMEDLKKHNRDSKKAEAQYQNDREKAYGKSKVFVFSARLVAGELKLEKIRAKTVAKSQSKLEGLAVSDKHLWLSYDGERPHFGRLKLSEFLARSSQ